MAPVYITLARLFAMELQNSRIPEFRFWKSGLHTSKYHGALIHKSGAGSSPRNYGMMSGRAVHEPDVP